MSDWFAASTAWEKILGAIFLMLTLLGGGSVVRRRISKDATAIRQDSAEAARADAEASYFNTAIDTITKDRDDWRARALAGEAERSKERDEHRRELASVKDAAQREIDVARSMVIERDRELLTVRAASRHAAAHRRMQERFLKLRYPDLDLDWLTSGPGHLESIPPEKP